MKYNLDAKNRRIKARKDILTYIGYDAATASFSAAAEAFCCKVKNGQLPKIVIETLAEAMQRHRKTEGLSVRTVYYWKVAVDKEEQKKEYTASMARQRMAVLRARLLRRKRRSKCDHAA